MMRCLGNLSEVKCELRPERSERTSHRKIWARRLLGSRRENIKGELGMLRDRWQGGVFAVQWERGT